MGGRFSRGWALTKKSWAVLKADRSLLVFPVIAGIATVIAAVIIFTPAVLASDGGDRSAPLIVAGIVAAYLTTFIAVFCNTALAACAARGLEGHDTSVSEGIAAARARLGPIVAWSFITATVGLILRALENAAQDNVLARLALSFVGVAWSIATFFVIPLVALEGVGGTSAVKRSAQLIRERWGEGVAGTFSIGGLVFLIAVLPAGVLIAGGVALAGSVAAAGIALIVVGAAVIVGAMLVSSALTMIFRVALYQYATQPAPAVGVFSQDELAAAFAPKKRSRLGRG